MIEFMKKVWLKPVLGSDQDVEECEHTLCVLSGKEFWRLPQHLGSRSKQHDQSDLLKQRVEFDWCYHSACTRKYISECEYQTLRDYSQSIFLMNHPTGFDHDAEISKWAKMGAVMSIPIASKVKRLTFSVS